MNTYTVTTHNSKGAPLERRINVPGSKLLETVSQMFLKKDACSGEMENEQTGTVSDLKKP